MAFWLALLVCALLPGNLWGQTLRVDGDVDHPASRLLHEILARDGFLLLTRDTVLSSSFRTAGDLIVLGADVRFQGTVDGSVAVIDGALFVGPGSSIRGPIASIRSAVLPSGLATMGEVIVLPPQVEARTERQGDGRTVVLRPPPGPPAFQLGGAFGFGLPGYDRVNGLSVRWGASLNPTRDTLGPLVHGAVSYHTARNAFGGLAAFDYPLGPELWIRAAAFRGTFTNEQWIRGDLANSLAAFISRSDPRNYFLSDEVSISVERRPRQPLVKGEGRVVPRFAVRASRDRSVESTTPWSVSGSEPWRENPPIDDGELVSILGGADAEWQGQTTSFGGNLFVEWAPPGVGDFSFAQAIASGQIDVRALWGHSVGLLFYSRQTLGPHVAPRQRWSLIGGSGTIPTLEEGQFAGDHVVFLNSHYSIPIPVVSIPLLGPPAFRLDHVIGSAWVTGGNLPAWEQNLGAGLAFRMVRTVVYINPADGLRSPTLNVSAALPF